MASLFTQSGESVRVLSPTSFQETHVEEDLQRWADANPHLLNEGAPMLSLGMEIQTRYDHWIDNLFVDGNGCLVVAELKRGLTPRDVTAQVIDYAAHVSRLGWPEVDVQCRKRHGGTELDTAFRLCFGRPLVRTEKIDLRLLIVAESYDPSVSDAALFLINSGTLLALLQFAYFEVGENKLFEVRTVLGEIPEQIAATAEDAPATPEEGRVNWVLASVADRLPDIAHRHGWPLRHFVRKQSLPFVSEGWPSSLDQCQLALGLASKEMLSLRLKFRHEDLPALRELVEERSDDWREQFPAAFANPPYPTVYTTLAYEVPMPEMGDRDALADVVERTERMVGVMVPLVTEYFEQRRTAAERSG